MKVTASFSKTRWLSRMN